MFDGHDQLMTRVEALERAILSLAASQLQELGDSEGHPFHGNQYTGGGGEIKAGHEVTVKGERGTFVVKNDYLPNTSTRSVTRPDGTIRVERKDSLGGTKSYDGRNVKAEDITGRVHAAEHGSITHEKLLNGELPKGDKIRLVDDNGKVIKTVTASGGLAAPLPAGPRKSAKYTQRLLDRL